MNEFAWTIPSIKINELKQFIGCKIISMVKYSYDTFQDYLNWLKVIQKNGANDEKSFFKSSYGSLFITLNNNTEYSFCIADDLNSIIMVCEKNAKGEFYKNYSMTDKTVLNKISVDDFEGNHELLTLLNQSIISITILTKKYLSPKQQCVPSEMGLEFIFANNKKMILSHEFIEGSWDFINIVKEDSKSLDFNIVHNISAFTV